MPNIRPSRPPIDSAAHKIARGVSRFFQRRNETCLTEFTLNTGRRVDIATLDAKGQISIVEIKTSVSDFRADKKWPNYLPFCDRFYFAVPGNFPLDILPEAHGLIISDSFEAEILRDAPAERMNAARRRALTLRFAHTAANRLRRYTDPPRRQGKNAGVSLW
ncbi:MAG: hypothetical protein ACJAU6_000394 [Alphaproteobacteria bacterium]|jgi:hypothetical protein